MEGKKIKKMEIKLTQKDHEIEAVYSIGRLINTVRAGDENDVVANARKKLIGFTDKYDLDISELTKTYVVSQGLEGDEAQLVESFILQGDSLSYEKLQNFEDEKRSTQNYEKAKKIVKNWINNHGYVDSVEGFKRSYDDLTGSVDDLGSRIGIVAEGVVRGLEWANQQKETIRDVLVNGSERSFAAFYDTDNNLPYDVTNLPGREDPNTIDNILG
jgi:hypothetical protein